MALTCIKFTKAQKDSRLGYADLSFGNPTLTLKGFTLWQKDGRRWLSPPSQQYKNRDGETKYAWTAFYDDKEVQKKFLDAARNAVDVHCEENNIFFDGNQQLNENLGDMPF